MELDSFMKFFWILTNENSDILHKLGQYLHEHLDYYIVLLIVFSLCFLISDLDFLYYSLYNIFVGYALAGPKIGQIKS